MKNWPAADAIDGNSVDQVPLSGLLTGAESSSEEAERIRLYVRKSQPANVDADAVGLVRWRQAYGDLWKLKVAFEKEHDRRVVRMIEKNNPVCRN